MIYCISQRHGFLHVFLSTSENVMKPDFKTTFSENFSEEALAIHEHQVEVMRNYYQENNQIFKLVEKRENMWNKLLEFEVRNS